MVKSVTRHAALALVLAMGLGSAQPGLAQGSAQDIPEEADLMLWCASAFHMLGIASEDEAESANFYIASEVLLDSAAVVMMEAQIPPESVEGLVEDYNERVVAEFEGGGEMAYTADECLAVFSL